MTISHQVDPSRWDEYVGNHPYGHHEQTVQFAARRAEHGFRCARVAVVDGDQHILGGAQILIRSVPVAGTLAYVNQGPLVAADRQDVGTELLQGLDQLARAHRITRLRIVNYASDGQWAPLLAQAGFQRSGYQWAERDTLLVRCDRAEKEILGAMTSRCQRNIRTAERKGVTVEVAGEQGLPVFHQLLQETARKRDFPIFPLEYFQRAWQLFAPAGKLQVFIASHEGIPLAGTITTAVTDTAYDGWAGMSSQRTEVQANYAVRWAAIRWARSIGRTWFDFSGGIGDSGIDQFKQRWGGVPTAYPDPFEKYYGLASTLRRRATAFVWQTHRLRGIVGRIGSRLHSRMAY